MASASIPQTGEVGPYSPRGKWYVGVYKGPGPLHGKYASTYINGNVTYAQFDDRDTGYGFGWWLFRTSKFEFPMRR